MSPWEALVRDLAVGVEAHLCKLNMSKLHCHRWQESKLLSIMFGFETRIVFW